MNSFRKIFDRSLGPDFWKFRLGQMVSLVGNGCRSVALSWWVLEKTGSPKAIAWVIAPAMALNLILLPLFGPLGDNFSRKKLIVIADLGRFATGCAMAAMVYLNHFNLPLLSGLAMLASVGTALFSAAESGIIPRIVVKKKWQEALQQSYAISSFGLVAGGAVGGIVVAFCGVFAGFLADAVSFLIAGLSSNLIQADTVPLRKQKIPRFKSVSRWKGELFGGFRLLFNIPVLFWIAMLAMVMNFVQAPLGVALPVYVKLARNLPAWYLGWLEGSVALGSIVGALSLGFFQRHWKGRTLLVACLATQGLELLLFPWVPGLVLPMGLLLGLGLGSSMANIPFETQLAMVIPDSHRSRFNSIIEFLCLGLYPLGTAVGSLSIAQWGLTATLEIMGCLGILLAPLILWIPKLDLLMAVTARQGGGFLKKHFPGAVS